MNELKTKETTDNPPMNPHLNQTRTSDMRNRFIFYNLCHFPTGLTILKLDGRNCASYLSKERTDASAQETTLKVAHIAHYYDIEMSVSLQKLKEDRHIL